MRVSADAGAVEETFGTSRTRLTAEQIVTTPREADWNNSPAERLIRPAAILRKNSQCNRSRHSAATQTVLRSIHRTLTLRGHDPSASIAAALTTCAATGRLPSLPATTAADG